MVISDGKQDTQPFRFQYPEAGLQAVEDSLRQAFG